MKSDTTVKNLRTELSLLYKVAQTVHSLELDELLSEIVSIAGSITKGDSCLVYILDPNTQTLVLRASKNPHKDLMRKITMKLGEGITGWVAKERQPVAISKGASKDPRFKGFRSLPEDTFEAFLSVPILDKHGVAGVINVQHKKKHIHSTMEVNLLAAIGKLLGGAVENALLIEETSALKEALALRKITEKAKGILMKKKQITEEEAYKLIQKESMNTRKSIKEVSEALIIADKLTFQ